MTAERDETTYTALELERYLAGELEPERAAVIERAAEEDEELKGWMSERTAERDAFLLDPRRRPFASLVEEAGAAEKRRRSAWIPMLSIVAAAAVVALIFVKPPENTGGFRSKGGISVQAAVLEGERSSIFDGNRKLHPGDRLRLSLDDAKGGYVTVLLEEQEGTIDVLYDPTELGKVGPGTHRLPGSLELDTKLGRERIYVLVSDEPPSLPTWIEEIERAHEKTGFTHGWLPAGRTRVTTLEYEKVEAK